MAITTVDVDSLNSYLSGLLANTPQTPYSINVTGLTTTSKIRSIATSLKNNSTKYVSFKDIESLIITGTEIPYLNSNISSLFKDCTTIIVPPIFEEGYTSMESMFQGCTNMKYSPNIPTTVTNLYYTFYGCSSLLYPPEIPSGVTNMIYTFASCTSLTEAPSIPNTVTTILSCFVGCSALTTVPTLPQSISDMIQAFMHCTSLENCPNIPENVTSLYNTFAGCQSLKRSPSIPNGVTDMAGTFSGCTQLEETPILPSSLTNMTFTFNKTKITQPPVIPEGVTDMERAFSYTLLSEPPSIPNGVTNMKETFESCTLLEITPLIPNTVTNMKATFTGCSSLTSVRNVPSSVTDLSSCFSQCSALQTINSFEVPKSVLTTNAQSCFWLCSSLTKIGLNSIVPQESDKWHVFSLKFGSSTVEGKVYGITDGQITTSSITQTSITKSNMKLPVLTDELYFPDSQMSDADLETLILGMLETKYSVFKKTVIPPNQKNFVLWADEDEQHQTHVVSNFLDNGGGIEVEVVTTSKSFTPTHDRRFIANSTGITLTLNSGATNGVVAEVFAMQSCTLTYYTDSSTTASLSMAAGSKAVFVYFSGGWALNSSYGTTNSVTANNMQSVSSNAVYNAIDAENTQVLSWLNGYGNNISYISQQALAGFNSYFANVANYTSFDYSTSSGVEYRIIGFKHTNYGTGIAFTRGYILGIYISNNQVTKQRVLFNMN